MSADEFDTYTRGKTLFHGRTERTYGASGVSTQTAAFESVISGWKNAVPVSWYEMNGKDLLYL